MKNTKKNTKKTTCNMIYNYVAIIKITMIFTLGFAVLSCKADTVNGVSQIAYDLYHFEKFVKLNDFQRVKDHFEQNDNLNMEIQKNRAFLTTAFLTAVYQKDNNEMVDYFISIAPAVNLTNMVKSISFYKAAEIKNVEIAKIVNSFGVRNINKVDPRLRHSALGIAIRESNTEVVKYFLSIGADMNLIDNYGILWHQAVKSGNVDIVKCFLDAGVDVNSQIEGMSLLKYSTKGGNVEVLKTLLEAGAVMDINEPDELVIASALGMTEICEFIISLGVDVNSQISEKDQIISREPRLRDRCFMSSALMQATYWGYPETVKYLLSVGADPNMMNAAGETARDIPQLKKSPEIINQLDAAIKQRENDKTNSCNLLVWQINARQ